MSSLLLKILRIALSLILITFESYKAIALYFRFYRPNRISVWPKVRRIPSYLVLQSAEESWNFPYKTR